MKPFTKRCFIDTFKIISSGIVSATIAWILINPNKHFILFFFLFFILLSILIYLTGATKPLTIKELIS